MKNAIVLLLILSTAFASGQVRREMTEEEAERKKKFSQAIILPFKLTRDHNASSGELTMLQIRPLYTITTERHNIINRPVIPLLNLRGEVGGRPGLPSNAAGESSDGLGDISYTFALERHTMRPVSVALGGTLVMPTASSDLLGTGKWSAGPAVMLIGARGNFNMLTQAQQIWSFAGDDRRGKVSNLAIEPIINYKLKPQWYLFTDPIITANWEAPSDSRWVVPVGGGGGHIFQLWDQWMDVKFEAYYNAVRPDNAPEWTASFSYTLLFKKPGKGSE